MPEEPNSEEVDDQIARQVQISQAFSPSSPITQKDLFRGRTKQMYDVLDVVHQAGQHAVIFGERGVGKTSLAQVMRTVCDTERSVSAYYTCSTDDLFPDIWKRILTDIGLVRSRPTTGFGGGTTNEPLSASELLGVEQAAPDDVRRALLVLAQIFGRVVIFVDEFDRVEDVKAKTAFADTIKILSDQAVQATVVLVGVADAVDDLIAEHQSIERSLVQVNMPRMSRDELGQIVREGFANCEMTVADEVVDHIVALSQGLPHYTHLIAQHAAREALETSRDEVDMDLLPRAVHRSLEGSQHSIREAYRRATTSNRETIYREVLLSCALADTDDGGTFAAADVREKLRAITHKNYDIPAFAQHLRNFSSDGSRGRVLKKSGTKRRFRYQFINPLLQPYVVMRGVAEGEVRLSEGTGVFVPIAA